MENNMSNNKNKNKENRIFQKNMKILVPYYDKEHTNLALDASIDITRDNDGILYVLHIYWDPKVRSYEMTEVRDRYSLQILDEIKPKLEKSKIKYELLSRHNPNFFHTILKTAKEIAADLIVLSKQRFKDSIIGSVQAVSEMEKAILLI
jgi:nucleotide-binding universal stress UspA family protein